MSLVLRPREYFMEQALQEAHKAFDDGEVPVGAVVVQQGKIIGRGHNRVEASKDPTAHAEILAIGSASAGIDNWRLTDCTMYVTLEPCPMCAGAILNSRMAAVIYGAFDPRLGALDSHIRLYDQNLLGRKVDVQSGLMAEECAHLLQSFFRKRRLEK